MYTCKGIMIFDTVYVLCVCKESRVNTFVISFMTAYRKVWMT